MFLANLKIEARKEFEENKSKYITLLVYLVIASIAVMLPVIETVKCYVIFGGFIFGVLYAGIKILIMLWLNAKKEARNEGKHTS